MNDKTEQTLTDTLRLAAHNAALAGLNGWGNLCSDAADTIDNLRTQLAEAQRDAEVNRQIKRACAELPDDYRIVIEIERDAGWMCLLRGGEEMDVDDPCEGVASSISAAIDAAREQSDG